jgi:ABC-type multidrug transport system ATPase subunit
MNAIGTQDLKKSFGDFQVVQGIRLEVAPGEIFSLFGPNGAGKTTAISMLSCLLRHGSGHARVAEKPSTGRGVFFSKAYTESRNQKEDSL